MKRYVFVVAYDKNGEASEAAWLEIMRRVSQLCGLRSITFYKEYDI